MITVQDLSFNYTTKAVLDKLSFTIKQGEIISILGANGCGKSTLLGLLRGILKPTKGSILWQGDVPHRLKRRQMALRLATVPQSAEMAFGYSVKEVVALGRFAHQGFLKPLNQNDYEIINQAMDICDIAHLKERLVVNLSGGEQQRVYLARALAQTTPTLILDEATSHLDIDHRFETAKLLQKLNQENGVSIIQVSHDLDLAAQISHRIILLANDGHLVAIDTPHKVYTTENLRQAFNMEVLIENHPISNTPRVIPIRGIRCQNG